MPMRRYDRWFRLILPVILFAGLASVSAQELPSNPLLDMLALVPVSAVAAEHEPIISYADYRAAEAGRGILNPGSREGFLAEQDKGLWINAMMRLIAGPDLSYAWQQIQGMPEVVGFDFFAIDRALVFGGMPRTGTILAGQFDTAQVGAALAARQFERVEYSGVTIWRRFDDLSINIAARDLADPFGGYIGQAARIAAIPGGDGLVYLANSAVDDLTRAMVAAAQDNQASLADLADYRSLVEAAVDPTRYSGPLIQASIYSMATVGLVPGDAGQVLRGTNAPDPTAEYGVLPVYTLAMLADRQEGDEEVHLIALVYTGAEVARAGAEELANRLRALSVPDAPDDILVERFGSTVTPYVYKSETTGQSVAVVAVRQTGPALGETDEAGMLISQGRLYRLWHSLLMRRQFSPLWLLTE